MNGIEEPDSARLIIVFRGDFNLNISSQGFGGRPEEWTDGPSYAC